MQSIRTIVIINSDLCIVENLCRSILSNKQLNNFSICFLLQLWPCNDALLNVLNMYKSGKSTESNTSNDKKNNEVLTLFLKKDFGTDDCST